MISSALARQRFVVRCESAGRLLEVCKLMRSPPQHPRIATTGEAEWHEAAQAALLATVGRTTAREISAAM